LTLLELNEVQTYDFIVYVMSRGSSVNIVTMLWTGRPGSDSQHGLRLFLLATASRQAIS
jgi:hypothetical protein